MVAIAYRSGQAGTATAAGCSCEDVKERGGGESVRCCTMLHKVSILAVWVVRTLWSGDADCSDCVTSVNLERCCLTPHRQNVFERRERFARLSVRANREVGATRIFVGCVPKRSYNDCSEQTTNPANPREPTPPLHILQGRPRLSMFVYEPSSDEVGRPKVLPRSGGANRMK